MAVVHEILRQKKQKLRFAGHTATHDFQILCAGNLTGRGQTLAAVDIAYVVGLEARGLSPHARRVMESGEVECTEWTNYALAVRLKAAAMGLPFLPARTMLGTDTFRHSAAKVIDCPFTGQKLLALPALSPDVAAIHVHEADRYGNSRLRGTSVADLELARAVEAAHHHLRTADPARGDSPRPDADRDSVLLRRRRLRSALRQLSRQHAVRVLLRRAAPAALAGRGARPGAVQGVPGRSTSTASRTSRSICSSAAACRACRSCATRSCCCTGGSSPKRGEHP